eukprot:9823725-Alexandrium_andersonii.AAC.1
MSHTTPNAAAFSGSAAAAGSGRTPGAGDLPSGTPAPPVLPLSSPPAEGRRKSRSRKGRRSRDGGGGDGGDGSDSDGDDSRDGDNGRSRGRQFTGYDSVSGEPMSTRKETCSDFTLPPIPKVPAFNEWRGKVQHAVCAASIFPNHALQWIEKVERCTMAELSSSGYFERLDYKLSGAIGAILTEKHRDPASEINRVRVEIQGNNCVMFGRQMLWAIRRWFDAKKECQGMFTLFDLTKLRLHGDHDM